MMSDADLTPVWGISRISAPGSALAGVIDLWVHGKSPHTQRYYRREAHKFLAMVAKPLELVTLADVQAYVTVLSSSELAASSQSRAISAAKSLFSFAHQKTGLLSANPAGPVTAPKVKDGVFEELDAVGEVKIRRQTSRVTP